MKYYKNTELAKLYHVSEKSVRNWVQASIERKNSIELRKVNDRYYVANTAKNLDIIEKLAAKGRKFKNKRGFKTITPTKDFYDLYSTKQIVDIMSSLDNYRESPLQYTYFNSGAKRWDQFTSQLLEEDSPNALTNTRQLLRLSNEYLDLVLADYKGVNIIDLGVGNALPVKGLLEHFYKNGKLKRYIGIDISKDLLKIAGQNVNKWFDGKVKFEGYIKDLNHERFDDLLVGEKFDSGEGETVNLVLFLGGTISNFREPNHVLTTIHESMAKNDLLIFSKKPDTERTRRYFDMAIRGNQEIDLVLKLLNINEEYYNLEQFFDDNQRARQVAAKLNVFLAIRFEMDGKKRTIELNKGERILLWRARHQNALEIISQFDKIGFRLIQATRSKDQDYLLTISRIKTKPE